MASILPAILGAVKSFSKYEMENLVGRSDIDLINQWIADGRRVAVFQNTDLGHTEVGTYRFASYENEPPKSLQDFPGQSNFRYQLIGVYEGGVLSLW